MKRAMGFFAAVAVAGAANAAPPIEAYGELAQIRSVALSPDGRHVAYLSSRDELDTLNIYELGKGLAGAVRTDGVKARDVYFAGPDHAIIRTGKTTSVFGYRGRLEFSAAFAYSLRSQNISPLPRKMEDIHPAQEGLGRIVGLYEDGEQVMMPAYMGRGEYSTYDLLRINLESGSGRLLKRGRGNTIDWIVEPSGKILAREDYNNKNNKYEVFSEVDGRVQVIFEAQSPRPPFSLVGVKPDRSALVLVSDSETRNRSSLYELGFDGKVSGPLFARATADVDRVLLDLNRVAIGVQYSGFYPTYSFFDPELNTIFKSVQATFSGAAVYLESWTEDFQKLLIYVEGTGSSGAYYIYHRDQNILQSIASTRPDIGADDVAQVLTIEYKARDGLTIPALLTLPLSGQTQNAPLIVMPHGGPEAHDKVGFDWMAQYFANRGYMILQPNFRGSDGFGVDFRDAGAGEWGGKMQDDVTDGVQALISSGRVDPSRVCIIGGSYGGYAALAGGAYTPDLYQCVAAIAPVTDLPSMLRTERRDHGSNHWVVDYWQELIGDPRAENDKLKAISPVNAADAFLAPVLLIHGKDDLVVPIEQSRSMQRALNRAGKSVELIELKGEDHWLSTSDARLASLKALDSFVREHIGAN